MNSVLLYFLQCKLGYKIPPFPSTSSSLSFFVPYSHTPLSAQRSFLNKSYLTRETLSSFPCLFYTLSILCSTLSSYTYPKCKHILRQRTFQPIVLLISPNFTIHYSSCITELFNPNSSYINELSNPSFFLYQRTLKPIIII